MSFQQSNLNNEYKVVIFGLGGVGKSAITIQFIRQQFVEEYDPTIEDSYRKSLCYNNEKVVLDILDTAGQEEYSSMRDQYVRSGDGFMLVFSIDNRESFEEVNLIYQQIILTKENKHLTPIIFLGNKCDLTNKRVVSIQEAQSLAQQYNVPFMETSAKLNLNIQESFLHLVSMMKRYQYSIGITPAIQNNVQSGVQTNSLPRREEYNALPKGSGQEDGINMCCCTIL